MIVVLKVAELMHDYVLYAMHGYLNQFDIECDTTRSTAASPASAHGADDQYGLRDTVTRCNYGALLHVSI